MTNNILDDRISRYAKALGHPARVRILRFLAREGTCQTGTLADAVPLAASTVSEHLRILRDAGLISGEVDGVRRCYCINREALADLQHLLQKL